MFKSQTRIVGLLAVVAALVPASVAEAKTRQYTAAVVASPLSTTDEYPAWGSTAYLAGTVESKRFGAGALIDRVVITGQPFGRNVITFAGSEVVVFEDGTQRNEFEGYSEVLEDGSQKVVIDGRFTGGTKRFRGATGRYTFRGTVPPESSTVTGRSRGRISF